MPPSKAAITIPTPMRLPVQNVRIRSPNSQSTSPCTAMLTSVLNCWAASGHASQGCAVLEQSLRACMDLKRPKQERTNNINSHLSRLYPKIRGPMKKDK